MLEFPDHGGHDMDLRPDGDRAYVAGEGGLALGPRPTDRDVSEVT